MSENKTNSDYWLKLHKKIKPVLLFTCSDTLFKNTVISNNSELTRSINKDKDCIVFVVEHLSYRTCKIGKALRDKGERIVVLCADCATEVHVSREDVKEWAFEYYTFNDISELACLLFKIQGRAIHCFTEWYLCKNAAILVRHKGLFSPVVVERYDIFNGFYTATRAMDRLCFRVERYVLRNADGIVSRDYGLEYISEKALFKLADNQLTLLDGIEKVASDSKTENKAEMHFVYCGGYSKDYDFQTLIEYCEANNTHFHLYPAIWDEGLMLELKEATNNSPFLHIHTPVDNDALIDEISAYDYLVTPDMSEQVKTFYNWEKIEYGTGNKFFDAFAAGLPIITTWASKQMDEMSKHGVVFRWKTREIDFDYLRKNKEELKKRVREGRRDLVMENQIVNLINFYNELQDLRQA